MAERVTRETVDDISGEAGASPVEFGLDGVTYQIDLTVEHESELRSALAVYVGHGRRVGRETKRTQPRRSARAVREWARTQGLQVPASGRIPATVQAAYDASH